MRTVSRYRNLPVKRKLVLIIMATVGAALIIALGVNLVFANFVLRSDIMTDLEILTEVVGSNSAVQLKLHDASAATEFLSALRAERHITTAALFTSDGRVFAQYQRDPDSQRSVPRGPTGRYRGGKHRRDQICGARLFFAKSRNRERVIRGGSAHAYDCMRSRRYGGSRRRDLQLWAHSGNTSRNSGASDFVPPSNPPKSSQRKITRFVFAPSPQRASTLRSVCEIIAYALPRSLPEATTITR
jgi:signal transduction protein with periplasmic or extracellular sensor domain